MMSETRGSQPGTSAMDLTRATKDCYFSLDNIRKMMVLWVVVSSCLVVYLSLVFGGQGSISRFNGYPPQPQSISRTEPPLKVPAVKNHTINPNNELQSGPTQPWEDSLVGTTEVPPTRKIFSSPFVVQDDEVTQGDRRPGASNTTSSARTTRVQTFAVIMNCMGTPPSCFSRRHHSVARCPYSNCRQIDSLERADVVVFYAWRMKTEEHIPKFRRPANQRWVMWTPEAAGRMENFKVLDFPSLRGQFNWTMTYRVDSDIVELYGRLQRQTVPAKNFRSIYDGKSFPVAWFVSHCHTSSRRNKYVKRMQKIVNVHIFGSCGPYNCSDGTRKRKSDTQVCLPMLSKSYHFYLAFENTLCQDYITEKFFKLFSDVDVIPVVRGGADYKRFFPPNTFIDASDYDSPEELAEFLLDLSKDRSRYASMLREKSRYRYVPPRDAFCDLCEKVMTDKSNKWYPDLRTWFTKDQCHNPVDL